MFFSIVTPTYNREKLISRVYDSLRAQTFRDFEWVVIDDGSIDQTQKVIEGFRKEADFPIVYHKKVNGGKVSAINSALSFLSGEWTVVFDSDDWCTPDALEKIKHLIVLSNNKVTPNEIGAVSVLKAYSDTGEIVGERYEKYSGELSNYIDRFNLGVKGDKWEIIRTDVQKRFPYPLSAGEKYLAPEYSWLMLAEYYDTIFSDEVLSIVEYQEDGISKNNILHRSRSPNGTVAFYALALKRARSPYMKIKSFINLFRFKLHRWSAWSDYFSLIIIPSLFLYIVDRVKLAKIK